MSVDITNVAYTFGNELKLCLYSVNPEVIFTITGFWMLVRSECLVLCA